MLTKKITQYINWEKVSKNIPLKWKELVDAKEIELKEKAIEGTISGEEKEILAKMVWTDTESIKAIKELTSWIKELVSYVKLIAENIPTS